MNLGDATILGVAEASIDLGRWRSVGLGSIPYAVQDVFTVLLFRIDAVILSLIASDAAVGRYGVKIPPAYVPVAKAQLRGLQALEEARRRARELLASLPPEPKRRGSRPRARGTVAG